ncbi:hypothetical protein B5X24_HaOG203176 [Helicoverpa armigera]|uniref:Uncharacterized protein n=1 Tax=Helicoverpa armigera TaxID=29058 RepID=A0A2W1C0F2_HELAM|nr:hypothetical protein B5X24_HaOG203176 [Helicoverpa armigera]
MTSTIIACVCTLGIILLTNVTADEYNDRLKSLLHTLTNQRAKYGLNFDHVDGGHRDTKANQISSHTHTSSSVKEIKPIEEIDPKTIISNVETLNFLMGFKPAEKSNDEEINDAHENLRMCKKKPKVYNCSPEENSEEGRCSSKKKKNKKNSYYYQKRSGRDEEDNEVDYIESNEAAELINDLVKVLEDTKYEDDRSYNQEGNVVEIII